MFIFLSAKINAFNLDWSNILSFGKNQLELSPKGSFVKKLLHVTGY